METYEELYKTICRVCLSYGNSENMVCLIDITCEDGLSCYGKAVKTFANISVDTKDSLPKNMCLNCLKILKHAIYFKLKCESSEKELLNLCKTQPKSESNLQETIVNFLMFREFFPQESSISTSKEIDDRSSDFHDSFFESDVIDNEQQTLDKDSADEELDILEKMVANSSNIELKTNYKPRVKRKIYKSKQERKALVLQKLQQRKQQFKKRTEKPDKIICKICQKVLANQNTYKYHMQRHNGCKFICEHCGKGFPLLVELNIHLVARHGTGPCLQCPHCPFKAPKKHYLVEHLRLHTGERPYTCDKCGLTFRRSAIWKKHMVYHGEKTGKYN